MHDTVNLYNPIQLLVTPSTTVLYRWIAGVQLLFYLMPDFLKAYLYAYI